MTIKAICLNIIPTSDKSKRKAKNDLQYGNSINHVLVCEKTHSTSSVFY